MGRSNSKRSRIAVVGAGISGLGAAWALSRTHSVTLYDQNDYLGGHANTVDIEVDGQPIAVDTGFIVFNDRNYPNLLALFEHLDVPLADSDMSFGVSLDDGRLEYSGAGLGALFAQRRNLLSPRFWRMLADLRRFYAEAPRYLAADASSLTLAGLLQRHGYGEAFAEDHLVPMAAAIWSASRDDIRAYPADAFLRFFTNHGLLQFADRPQWRTVVGGSRQYVRRLLADADMRVERATGVRSVQRLPTHALVERSDGLVETYDQVVLAVHADEALALLEAPSAQERSVLDAFGYCANRAWLHRDRTLMPQRRAAWSSWNYMQSRGGRDDAPLAVTYWMNRLQPLDTAHDVFVTLNPPREPDASLVHGVFDYTHPVFSRASAAQREHSPLIQGVNRTWFCGAWLGSGFHEDGLQSGLWVAEQLGAKRPWAHPAPFDRLPAARRADVRLAA